MIKHDNSGAGEGNLVVGIRDLHGHAISGDALQHLLDEAVPQWYLLDLAESGGVVEELVSGEEFASPSAQVDVAPDGSVEVVATHEQVLSGDSGQVYAGCTFPANPEYSAGLAVHAEAVARRLADLGARGRLSVDFVAVKHHRWRVMAIEVNLRKGGTTHPLTTLRHLVPGHYDQGRGTWVTEDGGCRSYASTDNLLDPTWVRLRPEAAIEAVARAGLEFDRTTGTGVILHMLSGLAIDGRCGLTAIAHSKEEANRLAQEAQEAIAAEGERVQTEVVGGPA